MRIKQWVHIPKKTLANDVFDDPMSNFADDAELNARCERDARQKWLSIQSIEYLRVVILTVLLVMSYSHYVDVLRKCPHDFL